MPVKYNITSLTKRIQCLPSALQPSITHRENTIHFHASLPHQAEGQSIRMCVYVQVFKCFIHCPQVSSCRAQKTFVNTMQGLKDGQEPVRWT